MPTTSKAPKTDRLEARIPHALKERLERAAALEGTRLSEFVTRHLFEVADSVIQTHEMMILTEQDTELFLRAVLDPPPPGPAIKHAAERYRELVGD